MPRTPIDYTKTIIYKLVCRDITIKELYVGATTSWKDRKNQHKSSCNNENSKDYHLKVYQFIQNNGGWGNWNMIMVEEYPCENKLQSDAREHYWTENLGAKLNTNVVGRTHKEYHEEHKEYFAEKMKEYREDNKEEITKKKKEYREQHKEEISEKEKEYREQNKVQLAEKKKEWYEINKEYVAEKAKEKYTCECGSIICKCTKARHIKSKKHLKYLEQ